MISAGVFVTTIISLCICFVLPLGYLFAVEKKRTNVLKPYWMGALGFFVAQVIVRLPLLNTIRGIGDWYDKLPETSIVLYALFMAFTTALCECMVRYLFVMLTLKDRNRFVDAVSMGVGHGLVESVLFTGVTVFGLLFYFICINTGSLAGVTGLSGSELDALAEQCMALTAGDMFLLGMERLSSMAMQTGYTVMIYKSVKDKKPLLAVAAMLWQMVPNTAVVLMQDADMPEIGIQLVYLALGLLGILYVYMVRKDKVWKLTNEKTAESLRAVTGRKF